VQPLQQGDAFGLAGAGVSGQGAFGRGNGSECVHAVAQRHVADNGFIGGVHEWRAFAAVRRDEGAVDVDLVDVSHGFSWWCKAEAPNLGLGH
jgi:hypothetical protein